MDSDARPEFTKRLGEWMEGGGETQRGMAQRLGVVESLVSMLLKGERRPSPEFMARAIARAPEPWKSALKQARQADQEAADLAAAQAVA